MTAANKGQGRYAPGSQDAERNAAFRQCLAEQWGKDMCWPSIMFETDHQQSRRDKRGDLNELGLALAYSSYVNREKVENFLSRKPDVVEVLNDLAPYLAEKHGVTEICLKHTACEDYDYDVLRVTPEFHTEDVGELIKLQGEISRGFFSRLDTRLAKDIVLAF